MSKQNSILRFFSFGPVTAVEISLIVLVFYYFGDDSISEEVVGFSPFMVSTRKNTMFIVSCV